MQTNKEYLYHPFTKSSFEFSIPNNSSDNQSFSEIENIDLYFQPVEHPTTAISMFIARFLIVVFSELAYIRLFKMVRKEKGLVNEVTQFYCITAMIHHPMWLFLITITDFLHPLKDIIGLWVCRLSRIIAYYQFNVTIFHSFIIPGDPKSFQ